MLPKWIVSVGCCLGTPKSSASFKGTMARGQLRENKPLSTHFPKCVDPDSYPLGVADPCCNAGMIPDLEDIITRDQVKWAISSFEPFKSPGPDDFVPALLQHAGNILH